MAVVNPYDAMLTELEIKAMVEDMLLELTPEDPALVPAFADWFNSLTVGTALDLCTSIAIRCLREYVTSPRGGLIINLN
jgi:hypothetical protein